MACPSRWGRRLCRRDGRGRRFGRPFGRGRQIRRARGRGRRGTGRGGRRLAGHGRCGRRGRVRRRGRLRDGGRIGQRDRAGRGRRGGGRAAGRIGQGRGEVVLRPAEHLRQRVEVLRPADQVGRHPGEAITIADQNPGGILVARQRCHDVPCVERADHQIGPPRPGAQVRALGVDVGPVALRRRGGEPGGGREILGQDGRRQVIFVDDRQGDDGIRPAHQVTPNPAEPAVVQDHDPARRAVAGHRGDLHAAQDLSDGGVIQARPAAHVDVIAEDVIAGRRRREGGIALGLRRARENRRAEQGQHDDYSQRGGNPTGSSQRGLRVRSISQNNPIQYHRLYGNTSADSFQVLYHSPARKD